MIEVSQEDGVQRDPAEYVLAGIIVASGTRQRRGRDVIPRTRGAILLGP